MTTKKSGNKRQALSMTSVFLFEVRDSDGNDCTVYDVIVTASTRDEASKKLWVHLAEMYPDDESDGGYGTFHACDCACEHTVGNGMTPVVGVCDRCRDSWECSHGGLLTNEDVGGEYGPQRFATFDAARAAHRTYRQLVEVDA